MSVIDTYMLLRTFFADVFIANDYFVRQFDIYLRVYAANST